MSICEAPDLYLNCLLSSFFWFYFFLSFYNFCHCCFFSCLFLLYLSCILIFFPRDLPCLVAINSFEFEGLHLEIFISMCHIHFEFVQFFFEIFVYLFNGHFHCFLFPIMASLLFLVQSLLSELFIKECSLSVIG